LDGNGESVGLFLMHLMSKAEHRRLSDRPVMPRTNRLPPGAHQAATRARIARAAARAADVAPIIAELQAAGVTSLNAIATALTARGIQTPRGRRYWHASQVARLLKRLAG
jgi:recombinase